MRRYHLNLELTGVIVLIAAGVLLPVMLSAAVGIVALVIARDAGGIVTGVLVVSFTAAAAGSALITVVLTGRKARLARRQADFVANISHEFRTPLSAIKLYAQTLQSGKLAGDPAQTAASLATILRETERLNLMVEEVLTWRAASRDMMKLEPRTRPVLQAVRDAVDRFHTLVDPAQMELSTSLLSTQAVRHDARALTAVLLNLLTNAYKYTGRDKRIDIRVRDAERSVVIEVQDNGIGLSAADLKRVFQPFYRAARQGGGSPGGVGLGLAIARDIVRRHHGTLTARSTEGAGSVFTLRLPAAEVA
jgi:two-component system, OmpR family, phosphate regulon sensor histidine kinase PhoR